MEDRTSAAVTTAVRPDYRIIADIITPGSRVLDLGCGTGELMHFLEKTRNAKVQGIELSEDAIYGCVEKGLSVYHGDIDSGLSDYPDKTFDYVILNQSLQEIKKIDYAIGEALRVGNNVIIGFPNFAQLHSRIMLFFRGKAPVTGALPHHWHDTPNLRFLSISDFRDYCSKKDLKVLQSHYFGGNTAVHFWPNLFARTAIFVVSR